MGTPPNERGIPNGDQIQSPESAEQRPDVAALKELAKDGGLAILIAGNPGTGTSTLDVLLRVTFDLAPITERTAGVGDRARRESDDPIIGFQPRPLSYDRKWDKATARRIRSAKRTIKIVEGRLAAWVGIRNNNRAQTEGKPYPRLLTVLVDAHEDDKVQRTFARDQAKYPNSNLTLEQYRQAIPQREIGDLEQFQRAHRELQGINPLDPNDPWSQENYDVILNSSELFPEDEVERIIEAAVNKFLNPKNQAIETTPQPPTTPQGVDDDEALQTVRDELSEIQETRETNEEHLLSNALI